MWRPRIGASHLMKGPHGIYYLRLAIPECVRALNPGLPKELKRSTLQAEKRAALAQAKQMCVDFLTTTTSLWQMHINVPTFVPVAGEPAAEGRPPCPILADLSRLRAARCLPL